MECGCGAKVWKGSIHWDTGWMLRSVNAPIFFVPRLPTPLAVMPEAEGSCSCARSRVVPCLQTFAAISPTPLLQFRTSKRQHSSTVQSFDTTRATHPTDPFQIVSHTKQRNHLTPRNTNRLDEIGTEERLPLPEWEVENNDGARMGGIGGPGGPGGHQARQGSVDSRGGGGGGSGNTARGDRPSADLGRTGGSARHVHARVSAEGRTRVLLISSHKDIRRTISTFDAKEASLVRQQWQGRLVLEKYLK